MSAGTPNDVTHNIQGESANTPDDGRSSTLDQHPTLPLPEDIAQHPPGLPASFVAGQFQGQTIRASLEEMQAANVGRKVRTLTLVITHAL
jgi:hypothetical protein